MKLYTENVAGNLHQASQTINQMWPDLVESVIAMDTTGNYTVVVFRVTEEQYVELTRTWSVTPNWEFGQKR